MLNECIGLNRFFVTFVDDYSRCCTVDFLKSGAEVPDKFKLFERCVANYSCQNIASLQSKNEREYLSQKLESYLESKGIHHNLAVPYSPAQNGAAEHMNRTLLESARSMMIHAGLQDKFWAEAVECAAYIRHCTPTSAIKGYKTPPEVWSGKKPDVLHLKVFVCLAYPHVPVAHRQKIDNKVMKPRFMGYSIQS